MRWFPVNLIVLLQDVAIDLYMLIEAWFFLKNVLTLLYLTVPCAETRCWEYTKSLHILKVYIKEHNYALYRKIKCVNILLSTEK